MTRIAAVHGVLAPYRYTQSEITDMVARTCLPAGSDRRVMDRLHESARVHSRHMALPLDDYVKISEKPQPGVLLDRLDGAGRGSGHHR
ncbi:type III polyketide synthase, partial [Streptomyces niveus]